MRDAPAAAEIRGIDAKSHVEGFPLQSPAHPEKYGAWRRLSEILPNRPGHFAVAGESVNRRIDQRPMLKHNRNVRYFSTLEMSGLVDRKRRRQGWSAGGR